MLSSSQVLRRPLKVQWKPCIRSRELFSCSKLCSRLSRLLQMHNFWGLQGIHFTQPIASPPICFSRASSLPTGPASSLTPPAASSVLHLTTSIFHITACRLGVSRVETGGGRADYEECRTAKHCARSSKLTCQCLFCPARLEKIKAVRGATRG